MSVNSSSSATCRKLARPELLARLEADKHKLVAHAIAKGGAQALIQHAPPMSVEVVNPSSGADPWIDFAVDVDRCGRFFRVTYSVLLTPSGRVRELFCSSPAGAPHDNYGLKVGVVSAEVAA